jgi:hypothetical protein
VLGLAATAAEAHGFGRRYELPVPLWLYLGGAAAAVALSFAVVAGFAREARRAPATARFPLIPERCRSGEAVAAALTFAVVLAGWFGDQNPLMNLAPTAVWAIWWVGLAYLSALCGNLWAAANPWAGAFAWAEALAGRKLSLGLSWPAALDLWPGVGLVFLFAWFELIYPEAAVPARIAIAALLYSVLTWAGMALFGHALWLERGEAFALAFGVFARLSPLSRERGRPATNAAVALVLLVLASVMFDGLLATPIWAGLAALAPLPPIPAETAGLCATWLLFIASYAGVSALIARAVGGGHSTGEIGRAFAFTLVPIALAYHVAHYLPFLVVQGQYLIPLLSDPLGHGWDLFGTAGWRVDSTVVGPRFAWFVAVAAIVLGHIAAVLLAHRRALVRFPAPLPARRGQLAMTGLMIAYTVASLSILAAPIVADREESAAAPAEIAVPADALVPQPGSGAFHPVGSGRAARAGLRFRALASPFHDGTRMEAADLLYAYSFAWAWGGGAHADPAVAAATRLARERLVGLRVAGSDTKSRAITLADVTLTRELLIVDVWADIDAADPDAAAAVAPPWSAVPWPVLALMDEAARRGWAAFSEGEARRRGLPWLDLVRDPRLNGRLSGLVAEFVRAGWRPPALVALVSTAQARARWTALAAFERANRHFLVTAGPYRLAAWSPTGATLAAFRDLAYPLGVGSFDSLPIPRRAYISKVETTAAGLRLGAEVEALKKFARSYELVREPLAEFAAEPELSGPTDLACHWLVLTGDGKVLLAGTTVPAADHSFLLPLAGRLPAGRRYTVAAAILVNGNAIGLEIAHIPYTAE